MNTKIMFFQFKKLISLNINPVSKMGDITNTMDMIAFEL